MGKSKSVGWNHVVLLQEQPPRVQCTLCDHVFPGTGTRIAEHLARIGNQVKHCTGDVPESVITQITTVRAAAGQKKRLREANNEIENRSKRRLSIASTAAGRVKLRPLL